MSIKRPSLSANTAWEIQAKPHPCSCSHLFQVLLRLPVRSRFGSIMVKPQRATRPGALTKARWQQTCLLCTEQPHLGSRLFFKDGGVGCKACHLNGSQDEFGRCVARIRVERFESHAQTQSHKDNVAALLKCPPLRQAGRRTEGRTQRSDQSCVFESAAEPVAGRRHQSH